MKKITQKSAFTLIELLIVIALLGALAIGLLATIDPFEQLKKGRDTTQRNTVLEFYNAELRYYATNGQFTWGTSGTAGTIDVLVADIGKLQSAGELKEQFEGLAGTGNLAKIYVNSTGATHAAICFQPESKSFQISSSTLYSSDGSTDNQASCKSQAGSADCFFCVQ